MKAKRYMLAIKGYKRHIYHKLEELEELETLATKVTQTLNPNKVQSTSDDKMSDVVVKIVSLEEEIKKQVDFFVSKKIEAEELINNITNDDYLDILYGLYFHGKKLDEIAEEMHMSYRWICKLHGQALVEVERLLKEKEQAC